MSSRQLTGRMQLEHHQLEEETLREEAKLQDMRCTWLNQISDKLCLILRKEMDEIWIGSQIHPLISSDPSAGSSPDPRFVLPSGTQSSIGTQVQPMNTPRLLSCPDRPHLLARCRAHQIHVLDAAGACHYPKICFTVDIFSSTGRPGGACSRVATDSRTIYGQSLYDWDCAFVDADRVAVAYRDAYFGLKTLCLLLYDLSRRQFRTCCLTEEDFDEDYELGADEDEENEESLPRYRVPRIGPIEARASAREVIADYMLKGDRLLIVSPPNTVHDYRTITVYRIAWPLETSSTLTSLWEPQPDSPRLRARVPEDFRRRRFFNRACFLLDEEHLGVFDGDGAPGVPTIQYHRFFTVDLTPPSQTPHRVANCTWTDCSPDPDSSAVPSPSTPVSTKDVLECPTWSPRARLRMWSSPRVWSLLAAQPPAAHDEIESDGRRRLHSIDDFVLRKEIDLAWSTVDFRGSTGLRKSRALSWPPPVTSFAINTHGGLYEADERDNGGDDDDEDGIILGGDCGSGGSGGTPRFVGYIGDSDREPPTLNFLASLAVLDSMTHRQLIEFLGKSHAQLRARGNPLCLARLAFVKS